MLMSLPSGKGVKTMVTANYAQWLLSSSPLFANAELSRNSVLLFVPIHSLNNYAHSPHCVIPLEQSGTDGSTVCIPQLLHTSAGMFNQEVFNPPVDSAIPEQK
jgi:hypothetical protein